MSAADYATINLFDPLGIHDFYWPADPQGVTHGWGDLALHPRDAAKIAQLLLHQGQWDGQQIVSRSWIAEATTAHTATNLHEDYGYGWYVSPPSEEVSYVRADGSGGQRILVVPAFDLVMVTTGSNLDAGTLLGAVFAAITDQGRPLPDNPSGVAALGALEDELAAGPAAELPREPPAIAHQVSGRVFVFADNPLGVQSLRLDFDDPSEAALMIIMTAEASARLDHVGLDGRFHPSVGGRPVVARGAWQSADIFLIEVDEGPGVNTYQLRLDFTDTGVVAFVAGVTVGIGRGIGAPPGVLLRQVNPGNARFNRAAPTRRDR